MALRIVKQSEAIKVERVNLCIYGAPGIGKTTLGFTAENPLLLDADEGAYRATNRKDSVPAKTWADIASIEKSDLEPYSTVIVDTAGRALDKLTADIISSNPKMGRGGALTLQGYGELKSKFTAWMKMLNSFGKDVVLLCHMDEQRRGDDVIERLDVQGGSKGEIYKSVDAMGKLYIENKKRLLDFSPRENSYGKNPGQFSILDVGSPAPDAFLANVIRQIKDNINKLTAAQLDEQQLMSEWEMAIHDLASVEDFNAMVPEASKASVSVKMLLHKAATVKGFVFNRKEGIYQSGSAA
jgi:AAA domain-containing protein